MIEDTNGGGTLLPDPEVTISDLSLAVLSTRDEKAIADKASKEASARFNEAKEALQKFMIRMKMSKFQFKDDEHNIAFSVNSKVRYSFTKEYQELALAWIKEKDQESIIGVKVGDLALKSLCESERDEGNELPGFIDVFESISLGIRKA